ncbi:vitamin B12 dependent-methionine synthase activation domain-containing protein [Hespellia stercorisuis]|uniref:Vitamin B12 dependent methionine synthase, activation domain n=1 Tax=Hespellia stercorisuis DSM 15480 TaxID=1121950 RepID=A0A1M6HM21_9FIRM|nr:vitamin B12 dependent-methionine synthase activation domain-containing protein [Hespellia stercorisuis]SHJ23256.1 Vitamin B12 dependent methionine synthase, activation domain [Hespellia stercorisuis DSM 15480]
MDNRTKETIRYLGYGNHAVDSTTIAMISDSFRNLESVANCKSIYRIFDLHETDENYYKIGTVHLESRNLSKNLKGCHRVVLFGATLGAEVDRLLTRKALMSMAEVVVLQAAAAAMLEEYCDECQEEIRVSLEREGEYIRPRFSPGYGDFDIHYQRPLMQMLDCAKKIGLTMTDSFMMSPTKSVTALIGVSSTQENCHKKGCEVCGKKDCIYRRDTV